MIGLFLIAAAAFDSLITWRGWYDEGSAYRKLDWFGFIDLFEDENGDVRRRKYLWNGAVAAVGLGLFALTGLHWPL